MTKEQWIKPGMEIAEHLKAINQIAKQSNLGMISMATEDMCAYAFFRDEQTGNFYEVQIPDEKTIRFLRNNNTYRTHTKA